MNFNAKKDTGYTRAEDTGGSVLPTGSKVPLLSGNDDDSEEELFERVKSGRGSYKESPNRLMKVKNELSGVMNTMKTNIGKVIDRGERLEDLEAKSESFEMSAFQFKSTSTKLKNRMWWHNFKMKAIFAFIVLVVLIVIIVWIVLKYKK